MKELPEPIGLDFNLRPESEVFSELIEKFNGLLEYLAGQPAVKKEES